MAKGREHIAMQSILESMNVPEDGVLLVHSGIRGLSHQGYRAEAIIDSLLCCLPRGSLLMPTMTWRTVTPETPIFDELGTPSHTGVLSEVFRTSYATARSIHPTHSVAGYGYHSRDLLSGHHLGSTPVPASSPYGLMRDYPSYILLLGVGIEMCTAIHHAEEMIAPDLYLKPLNQIEFYQLNARDGHKILYKLRRHSSLRRNFHKFIPRLTAAGMQTGNLDGVPWSLMSLANLMQIVFNELKLNPRATLENIGIEAK